MQQALFASFAEEFGCGEPEELATGRDKARQFHEGDACFFQRGDVMFAADRSGEDVVEMRSVAKDENGGCLLVFREFAEELEGFRAGKEKLGFLDFAFGVFEGGCKNFSRLKGAQVGAGEQEVGDGADFSDAFCGLFGLVHPLGGEQTLGVRWALGVFAVDGDAVAHDVQLHEGLLLK